MVFVEIRVDALKGRGRQAKACLRKKTAYLQAMLDERKAARQCSVSDGNCLGRQEVDGNG